jgi:ankyrin repeat protein
MAVADAIDAQSVAALIKAGADVNAKDADIDALFLAAEKGHIKVVKILIDNGADVYRETKMGSAHGAALHYGYPYVAQCIMDARKKLKADQEQEEE